MFNQNVEGAENQTVPAGETVALRLNHLVMLAEDGVTSSGPWCGASQGSGHAKKRQPKQKMIEKVTAAGIVKALGPASGGSEEPATATHTQTVKQKETYRRETHGHRDEVNRPSSILGMLDHIGGSSTYAEHCLLHSSCLCFVCLESHHRTGGLASTSLCSLEPEFAGCCDPQGWG